MPGASQLCQIHQRSDLPTCAGVRRLSFGGSALMYGICKGPGWLRNATSRDDFALSDTEGTRNSCDVHSHTLVIPI